MDYRVNKYFSPPNVSLRLKTTGADVQTVGYALHQAAAHLGNSIHVLLGK